MDRNKKIVKISILGIIVNLILVAFKAAVGLISGSIAIMLDAVNNLSDAMSSIITIIGTKLSEKRPNKKHPFGYGRIEYFSSIVIAAIVLIAGLTSFQESIEKIIHIEAAEYSATSLIIILVAVATKVLLGQYVRNWGKKLSSSSLVASGTDALSDAVLSFSTFVAAIVSLIWHVSIEGYVGVVISLIIVKTAVEIMKDTIDEMLGTRADSTLTRKIKRTIKTYPGVLGVYDLILHSYGPNKIIASAHVQLDDDLNVKDLHRLTRKIETDIYSKYGIILTLGVYASNDAKEYQAIKSYLRRLTKQNKNILEMHGFYVDEECKFISFDLVFSFDEENPEACAAEIKAKLKEKYPEYDYGIIIDADVSD